MKTIGLIGGSGWVSTLEYYRLLNEEVNRRLGGLEAARSLIYSFNFGDLARLKGNDPDQLNVGEAVVEKAKLLGEAGAECIVLCANTFHMFAEQAQAAASLPLIHIADAAASGIKAKGMHRVGLLGTKPTMEKDFYRNRLASHGIEMLVPGEEEREYVNAEIYGELVRGIFRPEVRLRFLEIMDGLRARGAEGIVMGCTEIPLLVKPEDTSLQLFDTLALHVRAIVDFALA